MYSREIVILANSRKYGGRCIAGIDIDTHDWVRVINNPLIQRDDPSVFMQDDLQYYYGSAFGPQLGDVVKIGFQEKCPLPHQPENELIDRKKWDHTGKMGYSSLRDFTDADTGDLIRYCGDTSDNISDAMIQANPLRESLAFIHLTQDTNNTSIAEEENSAGKMKTRLSFRYEGYDYDLVVTDETYALMKGQSEDEANLHEIIERDCYAAIGLGGLFERMNAYYKLVVGLIPDYTRDRYEHPPHPSHVPEEYPEENDYEY